MISDIPPFDLKLGNELYSLLLEPVEAGWKPSKSLIVVTNGALGLLPLSLLPTAPAEIPTTIRCFRATARALAGENAMPSQWSFLGGVAYPRHCRRKPDRSELIAFGDPLFSREQAAEAAKPARSRLADAGAAATTRGVPLKRRSSPKLEGVDSADWRCCRGFPIPPMS